MVQLKETNTIQKQMLKDKMNFIRANEAFMAYVKSLKESKF